MTHTALSRTLAVDRLGRLIEAGGLVFGMAFLRRTFLTGLAVGAPDMVGFKTMKI
jgi:hypothetical protein